MGFPSEEICPPSYAGINSHSWQKPKNLIRGYSWLFEAICGNKKSSGLCENMLYLIFIPCHSVYLEMFYIFKFQFLKFDPLKAQYGQNM